MLSILQGKINENKFVLGMCAIRKICKRKLNFKTAQTMFVFLFKNFLHVTSFVFNASKEIFLHVNRIWNGINFFFVNIIERRFYKNSFLTHHWVHRTSYTTEFTHRISFWMHPLVWVDQYSMVEWDLVPRIRKSKINKFSNPKLRKIFNLLLKCLDLERHTLHWSIQRSDLRCRKTGCDFQRLNKIYKRGNLDP